MYCINGSANDLLFFPILDELIPKVKYGKIDVSTELIIKPFKKSTSIEKNRRNIQQEDAWNHQNKDSLYNRLYCNDSSSSKSEQRKNRNNSFVIDSRTLENVHEDGKNTNNEPECSRETLILDEQNLLFEKVVADLCVSHSDQKSYTFRVIPRRWCDNEMNDVYLMEKNVPSGFDEKLKYVLKHHTGDKKDYIAQSYYVNVKILKNNIDQYNEGVKYPCIEINAFLMAHLKLKKNDSVILSTKQTVLNFVEKIELIPAKNSKIFDKRTIFEDFKTLIGVYYKSEPLLINQNQIFILCDGCATVAAKIHPESFTYCLCDAEILRENKICVSEQITDITSIIFNAEEIVPQKAEKTTGPKCNLQLDAYENIIGSCVIDIITKNCLNGVNFLRKLNNHIITGMLVFFALK